VLVNNVAQETYLGVAFLEGPSDVVAGQSFLAELALMYWPNLSYDSLIPGATFTIREGPHIIGFGTVQTAPINGATYEAHGVGQREFKLKLPFLD